MTRILRPLLAAAALALGLLATRVATEPVEGGGRTLEAFWCTIGALALAILALASGRRWRRFGLLAALFALATAAQLAMTQPLWLQYLGVRPWEILEGGVTVAGVPLRTLVLALQAAVVGALAAPRALAWVRAGLAILGLRGIVLGAALFVLAGAHLSLHVGEDGSIERPALWAARLAATGAWTLLHLAHLALLWRAVPREAAEGLERAVRARLSVPGGGGERPWDRSLPRVLALWVLLASGAIALFVYERIPHVPDGVTYLFQARCLARGALTVAPPPVPEAFEVYLLLVDEGRWYGSANPGWPAVLALGVLARATWLVNPLLGALSILAAHGVVRRLADRGTANLVALLLAASPWVLFLSASLMSEPLAALCVLAGWLAVLVASERGRALPAFAGGSAFGFLCSVRPLDGVLVGGLTGIACLVGRRLGPRGLAAYAAGCVVFALPLLAYNEHFTGSPFRFAINRFADRMWYPGVNRLGFGADVGNTPGWSGLDPFPGHGPRDVLVNANQNVYNLGFELFGWSIGSLLLALVHVARGRLGGMDRVWLGFLLALAAAYGLYWFSGGPDFGARYWYIMCVPIVWLSARGAVTLLGLLRERGADGALGGRAGFVLATLVVCALGVFVPWRAFAKYHEYRGFHADYRELAAGGGLDDALVLVEAEPGVEYACAFLLNDPELEGDGPVVARDLGEETNARLLAAFPDRRVVRVRGRTGPGDRARIVGGER